MTKQEMLGFLNLNVTQQGNEGAIKITPLLLAMIEKLFVEKITGVAPIVVSIASEGTRKGTRTDYEVDTPQELINAFVDSANENTEKTRLFVEDAGALIGFNFIEISEDSVSGRAVFSDGEFHVYITKKVGQSYFYHEEKVTAIPQVTLGEINAYKMIFNADYDKVENKYNLLVGATLFPLSPAEMIIVNEEYNKTSTDGNFTAMWANSISKYICCAPWFDEIQDFNLHSAFKNSKALITIDLNAEMLPVKDMSNAFEGCSRLEQISGIIELNDSSNVTNAFKGCNVLHTISIHGLSTSLDLTDCEQISRDSLFELIQYASDYRVLTISVHPNVLYKIENDVLWRDVKENIAKHRNIQVK